LQIRCLKVVADCNKTAGRATEPERMARCLWRLLACLIWYVSAEQVVFGDLPAPGRFAINGLRKFHVYSKSDFAAATGAASYEIRNPEVEIAVSARSLNGRASPGLEMSLVHSDDLAEYLDEKYHCKDHKFWLKNAPIGRSIEKVSAVISFAQDAAEEKVLAPLNRTGTWVLVVTNCGEAASATISGSVQVRNPYGHLPPEMYHKIGPICIFLFQYILLIAGWTAYSCSHKDYFGVIHFYLTLLLVWSVAEVAAKLAALEQWNETGVRRGAWSSLADTLYPVKWVYMYWVAISVSVGDTPYTCLSQRCGLAAGLTVVYLAVLTLREVVLGGLVRGYVSRRFVLGVNCPLIGMDAAVLCYMLVQTRAQTLAEEHRRDFMEARRFSRLNMLVWVCTVLASLSMLLNVFDLLSWVKLSWSSKWIPQDGAGHLIGLIALAGGMFIMRPGTCRKGYAAVKANDDYEVGEARGRASVVGAAHEDAEM